jgi:hypothetical protein
LELDYWLKNDSWIFVIILNLRARKKAGPRWWVGGYHHFIPYYSTDTPPPGQGTADTRHSIRLFSSLSFHGSREMDG